MPRKPDKPCAHPACPALVPPGQAYCKKHERQRQKNYNQFKRDKKNRRFYGSARWRKVSKIKKKRDPLCEYCLEKDRIKPAVEVDHIIPIQIDWSLRFDFDNLKSACKSCHTKKTKEDQRKYGKKLEG